MLPPGFTVDPNLDFIPEVKRYCGPDETILVMCAAGGRGARAVDVLARAGFAKVYNIVNGFDGELVTRSRGSQLPQEQGQRDRVEGGRPSLGPGSQPGPPLGEREARRLVR